MGLMVTVPAHQSGITHVLKKEGLLGRFDMLVIENHVGSPSMPGEIIITPPEVIQVPAPGASAEAS
jgi:hypothetical protein